MQSSALYEIGSEVQGVKIFQKDARITWMQHIYIIEISLVVILKILVEQIAVYVISHLGCFVHLSALILCYNLMYFPENRKYFSVFWELSEFLANSCH